MPRTAGLEKRPRSNHEWSFLCQRRPPEQPQFRVPDVQRSGVHLLPGLLGFTLDLAEANQIRVVRTAYDRSAFSRVLASGRGLQLAILILLSALARRKIRRRGLRCAGSFHGLAASGRLDTVALCGMLSRLGPGVNEIMCHPGFETLALRHRYAWDYKWETEAEALGSAAAKELVERRGISLRNFAQAWRD